MDKQLFLCNSDIDPRISKAQYHEWFKKNTYNKQKMVTLSQL